MRRAAILTRLCLLAAFVGPTILASCDGREDSAATKNARKNGPQPVPFEGKSFLGSEDLGGMNLIVSDEYRKRLERNKHSVVEYETSEGIHTYHLMVDQGDFQVNVRPAVDAREAATLCNDGRQTEQGMQAFGKKRGTVKDFSVEAEQITGSNGWVCRSVRADGNGIVKVVFQKGAFYVQAIGNAGAKDIGSLGVLKAVVSNIALYVSGKLR